MISLNADLHAAALRNSRRPLLSVTAEATIPEFTIIPGLAVPYSAHRFRQSASGYFFATAYDVASCTNIYYKRMTSCDAAADWNAGWSTLVSSLGTGIAYRHDLFVDGNQVTVCYVKSNGRAYFRESTDGGVSFSAEAAVSTHGGGDDIAGAAILDENTIYLVTDGHVVFRATRSVGVWSDGSDWDYSDYWTFVGVGERSRLNQFHAREMPNGDHRLLWNGRKGDTATFDDAYMICIGYYRNGYGWVRPAMGHSSTDFDYWHLNNGLSAELNGYYFCAAVERYLEKADASMLISGPVQSYELMLGRSTDLISWQLIPLTIYVSLAGTYLADAYLCYIAGVAVDGDNVIFVLSRPTVVSNVYTCPAGSWWGETASEAALGVLDDVGISFTAGSAAQTQISLNNRDGAYTDHGLVKPGATIRIYGGYNTASGERTQQRFTGFITSRERTTGADRVATFSVMDNLFRATSIKQGWPHLLFGQNVWYTGLADPTEVDYFVGQSGDWRESGGYYEQYAQGENAISLCGYEPDAAHMIKSKIRFVNDITDHRAGLVVHFSTLKSGVDIAFAVIYNEATGKIEIASVDTETMDAPVTLYQSAASFAWSADTDYWLLAKIQYGYIRGYYSTDGTNFTLAVSGNATSGLLGPGGYPGLYAYIDNSDATTCLIRFDDIQVSSAERYQSGSDVMLYLATISGMDISETMVIDDVFSGSVFSSRWIASTGNWSVSGGYARGYGTGIVPALKCSDVTASDIVLKGSVVVQSAHTGLFIRSNAGLTTCYAATVSSTGAAIMKNSAGSWSTLCNIVGSYSGNVELVFQGRAGYLTLYIDGVLACMAYDTDYEDGYCGLYSNAVLATPSQHDSFSVQAFYKPVDVATIRPGDSAASVMAQVAAMYPNGFFYADYSGDLKFGVFDDVTIDLDIRNIIIDHSVQERQDEILTTVRSVGNNAFAEVRSQAWAAELGGHRYENTQKEATSTANACYELAEDEMDKSQRITSDSITIHGYPGLEPCDVVGVAETEGGAAVPRQVLSFQETIGFVYEISLGELRPVAGETP